jgi:hypothetical protein
VETGRPTIPKASPRTLAVTRVDGGPRGVGCSRTVKAAVASFAPPTYLRAATGSLVDGFEPRIRELLRPFPRMPATANRGADRLAVAIP